MRLLRLWMSLWSQPRPQSWRMLRWMLWRILLKSTCYLSVVDAWLCSYLVSVTNKMHNYYLNVAAWCLCVFVNLKGSTWAYVKCLCLSRHKARYRLTWGVMSCGILRVVVLSDGDDGDIFFQTFQLGGFWVTYCCLAKCMNVIWRRRRRRRRVLDNRGLKAGADGGWWQGFHLR